MEIWATPLKSVTGPVFAAWGLTATLLVRVGGALISGALRTTLPKGTARGARDNGPMKSQDRHFRSRERSLEWTLPGVGPATYYANSGPIAVGVRPDAEQARDLGAGRLLCLVFRGESQARRGRHPTWTSSRVGTGLQSPTPPSPLGRLWLRPHADGSDSGESCVPGSSPGSFILSYLCSY